MSLKLKIGTTFKRDINVVIPLDNDEVGSIPLTITYYYKSKTEREEMKNLNNIDALGAIVADIDGLPIEAPDDVQVTPQMKLDAIIDHPCFTSPIIREFNAFSGGVSADQVAARKN